MPEQVARAREQLLQQIVDVEPVHHAERRLVQRAELGVLQAQLLGPFGDALLEALERLAQSRGHGVERDGQLADLVVRGHRRLARQVARGHRGRGLGDREDRLRDPPRAEYDAEASSDDDEQSETPDRKPSVRAGAKAER